MRRLNEYNINTKTGDMEMNTYTEYQARYFAEQLSLKRPSDSIDSMMSTLAGAKVDLNPHQVDAALFAFQSPLSQGVLLADEVGLGKTIEAGIAIAQYFAEHKRKILLIIPASLRNQWLTELDEKFYIKSIILESKNFNAMQKKEIYNPFLQDGKVVICSYNFASQKRLEISKVDWDLVIMDEAHRLRNVYKNSNVTGNRLKTALQGRKKILLTATPLQNNLMELYGLISILDERVFSDSKSFREKYINCIDDEIRNRFLKEKIQPFCKRTLRKQVTEYVPYTKREAILTTYEPTKEEEELYNKVSSYLQSGTLYALPNSQRKLMTMILRKLLASSSFAISRTLDSLVLRLENLLNGIDIELNLDDYDSFEELLEEAELFEDEIKCETILQRQAVLEELEKLKEYAELAKSIKTNAKGQNLLTALQKGFSRTVQLGGKRKAVIFTESRRTQEYLLNLLSNNGYEGKIVFLNGTNNDTISKGIYKDWIIRHKGEDIISGSRAADIKAAVVEEFRDRAEILIGTEAAAEGINLQFCSLLVNYDMPWNPQRIEQRIGRCHRYGQKNDVVVLNFVNEKNEADKRVYELLNQKFKLFEGLFGSSDEVLGSIESGVDFENRIAEIYQNCRTTGEIKEAFDNLQETYKDKIDNKLDRTKQALLENFDEDVARLLKVRNKQTISSLSQYELWLYYFVLSACYEEFTPKGSTRFVDKNHAYFNINWKSCESQGDHFLRKENYIIQDNLNKILEKELSFVKLEFDYTNSGRKISYLDNILGKKGVLDIKKVTHTGFEKQQKLIVTGLLDNGLLLEKELIGKILELPAVENDIQQFNIPTEIEKQSQIQVQEMLDEIVDKNKEFFLKECNKLNDWGEEMKDRLQEEIKEIDRNIKDITKEMQTNSGAYELTEIIEMQQQISNLKKERSRKRATMFDEEDRIEEEVTRLQAEIQKRMNSSSEVENIFTVQFEIA